MFGHRALFHPILEIWYTDAVLQVWIAHGGIQIVGRKQRSLAVRLHAMPTKKEERTADIGRW